MKPMHDLIPIPEGKTVGDLLPAFYGVKRDIFVGKPNPACVSCGKPFNDLRKRRKAIRLYPVDSPVPVAFSYDICGRCVALHHAGGASRDGVLAAVQAFSEGQEATQ